MRNGVGIRGRNSGREYVTPTMYLPHDTEPDSLYVFATKGGAATNPDWYQNLTAAGDGSVERGTETYKGTVRTPKTGQRGSGDLRGIHPSHRLVAHRGPAADTPDSAPGSITMRELEGAQALLEAEEAVG